MDIVTKIKELMMKLFFKKSMLFALIAALTMASLPFVGASAAGTDDSTPPAQTQLTNERLEKIWAHQIRVYERMGRADELIARAQRLIDRLKANGKDVSALQAALDEFAAAVKEAHPVYESMKDIVNSHQGFDSSGKVTDPVKARETVKSMHEKIREIKTTLNGTGKALREAIKAFRQANPRLQPTATP
jgi:phosphoserine phosphatase